LPRGLPLLYANSLSPTTATLSRSQRRLSGETDSKL
jgi:hypothetical protein